MTESFNRCNFSEVDIFLVGRNKILLSLPAQTGKSCFNGRLAEWLGSGLQNRVRRFESATDLDKN